MSRLILVGLQQPADAVARTIPELEPDQVYMSMSQEAREFLGRLERALRVSEISCHRLSCFQEPGPRRTAEDVFKDIQACYQQSIIPELKYEYTSLVIGGESILRAVIRCIEGMSVQRATQLQLAPSEVRVYELSGSGRILGTDVRSFAEAA